MGLELFSYQPGALHVPEVSREAGDVGGVGQVGGAGDEQGPPVVALGEGVDVRPPGPEGSAVRGFVAGALPHLFGVVLEVENPLVGEHLGRLAAEPEPVDGLGHRAGNGHQPVGKPFDEVVVPAQHLHHHLQVGFFLGAQGLRAGRRRGVHALVLDPVTGHELFAHRPELLGVDGPRDAVAGGVVLPVPAAFAGLEPRHARDAVGIGPARPLEDGPGHRPPFRALLGARDPPSVGGEPVHRRAVDHARGRPGVDAEVVPVDEEDEV